jgi:hypothetical protein
LEWVKKNKKAFGRKALKSIWTKFQLAIDDFNLYKRCFMENKWPKFTKFWKHVFSNHQIFMISLVGHWEYRTLFLFFFTFVSSM